MQRFLSTNNHQWSRIHLQRWKRKLRFVQCWNQTTMSKMSNHEMLTGKKLSPAACKLAPVCRDVATARCELALRPGSSCLPWTRTLMGFFRREWKQTLFKNARTSIHQGHTNRQLKRSHENQSSFKRFQMIWIIWDRVLNDHGEKFMKCLATGMELEIKTIFHNICMLSR